MRDVAFIPDRFRGKTVIVTGAGSGIGRATALRLGLEGARVIASDIVGERLDEVAVEHLELRLVTVAGDVSREETVDRLVAAAEGRVDGLVNNAGIMDTFLPPAEVDDATWERVFAVNVTALMRTTRAVLPLMLEAGAGAIVNVTSVASLRASAAGCAYTASKHAANGYTKSTAMFYKAQGVRANVVAPGAVMTDIEVPWHSAHAQSVLSPLMGVMVPSVATSEQVAATITWLLSDDASNVNGAIVTCDGGWSAI